MNAFTFIQKYQQARNLNLPADIGLIVLIHDARSYILWGLLVPRSVTKHHAVTAIAVLDRVAILFTLVTHLMEMQNW
jgi:hypothetical protein